VEELGRDVGELEAGLPQVLQRLKKQSLAQAILDAYGHLADLEARLDILEQPEPPAPPVVHDVIVVPNAFPLAVGDVLALGATVLADDGYAGGVLTWTSSNAAAATVVAAMDGTAQVTGVAPGDARITAEIGGQSAAVGVSVVRRQATKGGGKTAARRAARGPAKTAAKGGAGRRRGGTQPPEPAP
jgi:hypothetical protein